MALKQLVDAHFTAERWGLLQYLLAGMIDPRYGIVAPYKLIEQGYGDDFLQLQFLSGVLADHGIDLKRQQLVNYPVTTRIAGKINTAPMPALRWTDEDGTHDFCPCPFFRFGTGVPEIQPKPAQNKTVEKFMASVAARCTWKTLVEGDSMTDAVYYQPVGYPSGAKWDSESQRLLIVGIGSNSTLDTALCYTELSRYVWENGILVVHNEVSFSAEIRFDNLAVAQLEAARRGPIDGLNYLLEKAGSRAVPRAGLSVAQGCNQLYEQHAPLFVKLLGNIMALPERQQKTLIKKIAAANAELVTHEPPQND
ncbi:MAG: hypothetical protein WCG99_04715 [Candidatus Berkelbacteria bacterium]